jgi:hypothetical protein
VCETLEVAVDDGTPQSIPLPGDGIILLPLPNPCEPESAHTVTVTCLPDGTPETCTFQCPKPPAVFKRGDANRDGIVDITDPIYTLQWLFAAGPEILCMDAADANDDEAVSAADAIYTLQWLFVSGPALPLPGPGPCGPDETDHADGPQSNLPDCDYCPEACLSPPVACPIPAAP